MDIGKSNSKKLIPVDDITISNMYEIEAVIRLLERKEILTHEEVLDCYSRYIIHHDLRAHMQEDDVEIVIQAAIEKYPEAKLNLITDNGSQYISKDFAKYLKIVRLQHIRTSLNYP